MQPPSRIIAATAIALLVANAVAAAQRSSPQFSFPPPTSDLFSSSGQDLVASSLGQPQSQQQQQSQQSQVQAQLQAALAAQQQQSQQLPPAQQTDSQLIAQSQPALVQRQPALVSSQSSSSGQSRPSQSQPQPQASSVQASAAGQQSSSSNSRHRPQQQQQQQQHSQTAAQPVAHHQTSGSHVAHSLANRHPANLQVPSASSSNSASHQQSQQQAIEAARKTEATQASLAASAGQSYHCPDSFGYFRHHKSCDKYYACDNGTATLKLCGNGLMFDDADPRRENCAYPFSVDCGERSEVEAPISTPHCPRLYGLFPDTTNCRVFYSCWNGEASRYECPAGLAYDSEHRVCVWADHVDRCDQSEVSDGFVCPDPTEADQPGHYTRHAHPTDCRKFYVCIEGVARPYGCSIGTVFNVDSLQCDEPDNVSGCEKYYGDMDPKLAKKLARENIQQSSGGPPARSSQSTSSSSSSSSSRSVSTSSNGQASQQAASS